MDILWLAMLIPFTLCIIAFYFFSKKFVYWEMLLPMAASLITILIFKYSVETSLITDTQYRGGLIIEARYYESWSTWVHKTCYEKYACGSHIEGSGKNRHSVTDYCERPYDCSYCDDHDAYWEVKDDQGHSWNISQEKYNELKTRWNATPVFIDMNRNIEKHGNCGVDGDAYSIKWNANPLTSEPSTVIDTYTNKVQAAKSGFNLTTISKKDAVKYNLYEYPNIINSYSQHTIQGLDSFPFISAQDKDYAVKRFDYFNGYYGPKRKMRVYICLFSDKQYYVGIKQKDYWDGGNKNEVLVFIDADRSTGKLNWVQVYTWSTNKRIAIDLREDISNIGELDMNKIYTVIEDDTKDFRYRNFHDFDYLRVEIPTWEVWVVYILTTLISIGLLYFGYKNEFEQTDDRPLYTKNAKK